jgi:hypothetical protein
MNIFSTLTSGDSATWNDDSFADAQGKVYDSSYTLKYSLRGAVALVLTAVANGSGWTTTLTPTQSATLTPGTYWWSATLTKTGERVTASSGEVTITPDVSAGTAIYDGRTQAEKDLAAVQTAISARVSGGAVLDYTIGSRTLKREPMVELLKMRSSLLITVRNEQRAKSIINGMGDPTTSYVRFIRS